MEFSLYNQYIVWRKYRKHLPLVGLLLFHLVANWLWLGQDSTPPAWDQAAHIRIAVLLARWLGGDRGDRLVDIIHQSGGYPPLVHFGAAMWSLMAGVGIEQITFFNTIVFLVVIIGVYKLAELVLGNWKWAWVAAVIFSLFPVIYDISRNFLLDLAAVGWVVWGLYFFIKSKDLEEWPGLLLFTLCLVGISLTKLNGLIYFVPLVGLATYWAIRRKEGGWILKMIVMGSIWLGLVGWWWMVNFVQIREYLTGLAGQGEPLTDPMNLTSLATWFHYYRLFFLNQATPIAAVILTFLVGNGILGNKNNTGNPLNVGNAYMRSLQKDKIVLILFVLFNYVVFTIIKNKDFRFTMPLLPVVAILAVVGLKEIANKYWRGGMLAVLLVYWGWFYVNNSFGWPVAKDYKVSWQTWLMGKVDVVNISDYPVRMARVGNWPQERIVTDVGGLGKKLGRRPRVLVLINKEEINDNNLGLYRDLAKADFDIGSVGGVTRFNNSAEIGRLVANFDAFLVADASFDPAPFYGVNLEAYKQARDWILERKDQYQEIGKYRIYGDKELWLLGK